MVYRRWRNGIQTKQGQGGVPAGQPRWGARPAFLTERNPAPPQLTSGGRGTPVSTDPSPAKVQFSANGVGPSGAVLTVLPTMLLLPPLSTFAAGAREVPFWKIFHLAMRALEVPTTFTPVPLLLEMVVLSMLATLPAVGSAV